MVEKYVFPIFLGNGKKYRRNVRSNVVGLGEYNISAIGIPALSLTFLELEPKNVFFGSFLQITSLRLTVFRGKQKGILIFSCSCGIHTLGSNS